MQSGRELGAMSHKKSQTWSMDIMLAVVIFIGAIFVVYSILSGSKADTAGKLEEDAALVLDNLASEDFEISVVDGVELNEAKLLGLLNEEYPDLKQKIRAGSDFCIFLEDEEGKLVYISNKPGIGSDKIKVSDQPCE